MSRKAVPLGGSRDPVKTSFKGRATLAHALSRDVPVQRTLATLHKAEGIVSIYARLGSSRSTPVSIASITCMPCCFQKSHR